MGGHGMLMLLGLVLGENDGTFTACACSCLFASTLYMRSMHSQTHVSSLAAYTLHHSPLSLSLSLIFWLQCNLKYRTSTQVCVGLLLLWPWRTLVPLICIPTWSARLVHKSASDCRFYGLSAPHLHTFVTEETGEFLHVRPHQLSLLHSSSWMGVRILQVCVTWLNSNAKSWVVGVFPVQDGSMAFLIFSKMIREL